MSTAIQQITVILAQLTPSQRAAVEKYVDLSNINIMKLTEQEARVLLLRLNAAVATVSNPIKDGIDERQAKLERLKDDKTTIWEDARKNYYAHLRTSDGGVEDKKKSDELFFAMQLAGEHMVDATKRANNSAIQGILFNA